MLWWQLLVANVKKYWSYVTLVAAVILGIFLFRRSQTDFVDQLKKLQDAHDEELKKIQKIRDEESAQHALNEKRLNDALTAVQQQYDAAKRDLDDKKRREIKAIVEQYGEDPVAMANKLSESTGFTVIMPD